MKRLGLLLARVDVRLALYVAGLTAAFTSALLCGLLVYALKESLEEQVAVADAIVTGAESAASDGAHLVGTHLAGLHPGSSYRVRDEAGHDLATSGTWPADERIRRAVTVWTALEAQDGDFLVRERPRAAGGAIAAALPLRHFVRERGELMSRTIIVVVLGMLGAIVLGVVSARRALRPLRETTAAIRAIDPRHLAARVPMRGNADDIDALALATNQVLTRLESAFGRLAAFSADAAHELRTPVNRILNTAEVALTTTDDLATKDDALAAVRDAADGMRRSIDQLLLLARGEDGGLHLVRDDVDLGRVIDGLGELYAPTAERLDKRLLVTSVVAVVRADRELIERAVANLLENALGHTQPGATIRIGIERQDAAAVIVVDDSGPGIAEADRERIFDRFVRLDEVRTPDGTGLGLPIARMVARLHDGDLTVGASALGGSAFRLKLPLGAAASTACRERRSAPARPPR